MKIRVYREAIIVLVACVAGGAWLAFNLFYHAETPVGCLFHKITHVPCPACGSTRSVVALLHGDIAKALWFNPFGFVIVVLMFVLPCWVLFDIVAQKETFRHVYYHVESFFKKIYIAIPAILLVLANWVWNIFKY